MESGVSRPVGRAVVLIASGLRAGRSIPEKPTSENVWQGDPNGTVKAVIGEAPTIGQAPFIKVPAEKRHTNTDSAAGLWPEMPLSRRSLL